MIDLTTLAAAKAYTDKKCGNAGGGLPVVEFSQPFPLPDASLGETEGATVIFTEAESAILSAALEKKLPCVLIFTIGDSIFLSGIARYSNAGGLPMYTVQFPEYEISLLVALPPDSAGWEGYIQGG